MLGPNLPLQVHHHDADVGGEVWGDHQPGTGQVRRRAKGQGDLTQLQGCGSGGVLTGSGGGLCRPPARLPLLVRLGPCSYPFPLNARCVAVS